MACEWPNQRGNREMYTYIYMTKKLQIGKHYRPIQEHSIGHRKNIVCGGRRGSCLVHLADTFAATAYALQFRSVKQ